MQTYTNYPETLFEALASAKEKFISYNVQSGNYLEYKKEAKLVYDMVVASQSYEWGRYCDTPMDSIVDAFLGSAKTGLSFDSSKGQAFLKCIYDTTQNGYITQFDFGYKGFLLLASRSGVVKLITADVIYESDKFQFNGTMNMVTHEVTSLSASKRGAFAGGYCTTELTDGSVVTTVMSPEEINEIEYEAKKNYGSAWSTVFIDEMRRKTLIRRHWKTLSTVLQRIKRSPALAHVDKLVEVDEHSATMGNTVGYDEVKNANATAGRMY